MSNTNINDGDDTDYLETWAAERAVPGNSQYSGEASRERAGLMLPPPRPGQGSLSRLSYGQSGSSKAPVELTRIMNEERLNKELMGELGIPSIPDLFAFQRVKTLGDHAVHTTLGICDERGITLYTIHRTDYSCCPEGKTEINSQWPFYQGRKRWEPDRALMNRSFDEIISLYKADKSARTSIPSVVDPADDWVLTAQDDSLKRIKSLDPTLTDPRIKRGDHLPPVGTSILWGDGDVPPAVRSSVGQAYDAWMARDAEEWVSRGAY